MTSDGARQPVAVIIGAATGIGAALAESAGRRGYSLAVADLQPAGQAQGVALAHQLDVRDARALDAFAADVFDRFGRVDLLFNNAGIMRPGRLWEQPEPHLNAVIDINLGGVINGVRSFVPRMIASRQPGRIVNTASLAGLIAAPGLSAYCISKHAVVALSETLAIDLRQAGHPIEVSVICPGAVATNIMDAAVAALADTPDEAARGLALQMAEGIRKVGAEPAEAAESIFAAIDAGLFWIRPRNEPIGPVIRRATSIEAGLAPRFQGWED